MRCPRPDHTEELQDLEGAIQHLLHHVIGLENRMTEFANDQAHLEANDNAIATAFAEVVAELKAQATAAGVAQHLDFTKSDALVAAVQSEATADAPAAPAPATPAPADTTTAAPAPTGPTDPNGNPINIPPAS